MLRPFTVVRSTQCVAASSIRGRYSSGFVEHESKELREKRLLACKKGNAADAYYMHNLSMDSLQLAATDSSSHSKRTRAPDMDPAPWVSDGSVRLKRGPLFGDGKDDTVRWHGQNIFQVSGTGTHWPSQEH